MQFSFLARTETYALSDLIITVKRQLSGLKPLSSCSAFGGHVAYPRAFQTAGQDLLVDH